MLMTAASAQNPISLLIFLILSIFHKLLQVDWWILERVAAGGLTFKSINL